MAYTVKKLAEISGVSVRTLHFYDEIDLLKPAYLGENGYRFYEEEQLLTLQQILFFRELGLSLDAIRNVMAKNDFDKIQTLESHRRTLEENLNKTRQLIRTIDKTIGRLKGELTMKDDELYLGFDPSKQREYEKYLIENYGGSAKIAIAESKKRTSGWRKGDYDKVKSDYDAVHRALARALEAGEQPQSPNVQKWIATHFGIVSRFYTPTKAGYAGLGQLYIEHPDFRKLYESYHPRLAEFLAEAMSHYAEQELG